MCWKRILRNSTKPPSSCFSRLPTISFLKSSSIFSLDDCCIVIVFLINYLLKYLFLKIYLRDYSFARWKSHSVTASISSSTSLLSYGSPRWCSDSDLIWIHWLDRPTSSILQLHPLDYGLSYPFGLTIQPMNPLRKNIFDFFELTTCD